MNICYFGTFDINYQRNRIIRKGLEKRGFKLTLLNTEYSGYIRTNFKLLRLWLGIKKDFEAVIVGESEQALMPLAWILCKFWKKKLFIDAFFSWFDTLVMDRQLVRNGSFEALKLFFFDKLACRLADFIICDTKSHADFFINSFKAAPEKFIIVYVGADNDIYKPLDEPKHSSGFIVSFWGTYIPLQGTDKIIRAAAYLKDRPDIKFRMIGSGQTFENAKKLISELKVSNITILPYMKESELAVEINKADLCLGIFGSSGKARRVIPHKIFQASACGKPTLTMQTPALKECYTSGLDILTVSDDPKEIAESIMRAAADKESLAGIAEKAHELYEKLFKPDQVVISLAEVLNK